VKHEAPPFRMIIERGKLVPATPYDAERLDTYRTGTPIKVRLVEEKDRILVRKWFAVIGRAVKECATPWKTKDEASEAIKLALGIVNLTKTVGGEFLAYPKSLTELTDPELEEAVEQMLAVLYRITGVDPDDWRKHIADIGEDEPVSDHPPSPSETAGSASDNPTSPGLSDDATEPAEPVEAGAEGQEQSEPAPASDFTADEWKWLRESGRMLWAFAFTGEIERVQSAAKWVVVPSDIGQPAKDKLRAITKICIEVADGEDAGPRRQIAAMHMGVAEDELKGVEP
jgi:hypothetical protein